jgi:hypothetical protein
MTVFIVQEVSGRNVIPAKKYGDLKLLLPERTNLMLSTAPTVRKVRRELSEYSDEDYLLLMGDPAAIGLACAVAASTNQGRFKILKWDRQESVYYPVNINLFEKGETELGELHV